MDPLFAIVIFILGALSGMIVVIVVVFLHFRRVQERVFSVLEAAYHGAPAAHAAPFAHFPLLLDIDERVIGALEFARQSGSDTSRNAFAKQLHHRLKNSLQTLSSLLHLQISNEANEECKVVLRTCLLRLLVFAAVYRVAQTDDEDTTVDLALLIIDIVEQARRIFRLPRDFPFIRIDTRLGMVSADVAIPLGLAIVETLILAIAQRNRTGEADCRIHIRSKETEPKFVFTIESSLLESFVREQAESSPMSRTLLLSYATQITGSIEFMFPPSIAGIVISVPSPTAWNVGS